MPWNPEFKANCFFKVAQGSWYSTNEGYQTAQDDRNDRVPKVQKTIKYDQPYCIKDTKILTESILLTYDIYLATNFPYR